MSQCLIRRLNFTSSNLVPRCKIIASHSFGNNLNPCARLIQDSGRTLILQITASILCDTLSLLPKVLWVFDQLIRVVRIGWLISCTLRCDHRVWHRWKHDLSWTSEGGSTFNGHAETVKSHPASCTGVCQTVGNPQTGQAITRATNSNNLYWHLKRKDKCATMIS